MKLALTELRRRPGRFALATGVLTLIVVLLLFLGGLLDGLYEGSTGAISTQDADVFVYSSAARDSFLRSRIEPDLRQVVTDTPGVKRVAGLGIGLLHARTPDSPADDLVDVALIGYERPTRAVPAPPTDGEAYADRRLEADGVRVGRTIAVGQQGSKVKVIGWVDGTNYLLQGGLWVNGDTWRKVLGANRPDLRLADGVFQVLIADGHSTPARTAAAIERATGGRTSTLTRDEAVVSIPGTREQQATFLQIIGTTLGIAVLVVALFFSLLTLERVGLYGVLKAMGASSRQLFAGVTTQAVLVTFTALVVGGTLTFAMATVIPPGVPLQLTVSRAAFVAVGMLGATVLGSVFSLRRVIRVDPASAIGSAS